MNGKNGHETHIPTNCHVWPLLDFVLTVVVRPLRQDEESEEEEEDTTCRARAISWRSLAMKMRAFHAAVPSTVL